MAITRASDKINKSPQEIQNLSFDTDFNVTAVEVLGYNPTSDTLERITTSSLGSYSTNNIDEASDTVTYIGKEDADGAWFIMKIDTSSGTAFTYATITNNTDQTTGYADAFADRATLTYSTYSTAF